MSIVQCKVTIVQFVVTIVHPFAALDTPPAQLLEEDEPDDPVSQMRAKARAMKKDKRPVSQKELEKVTQQERAGDMQKVHQQKKQRQVSQGEAEEEAFRKKLRMTERQWKLQMMRTKVVDM